MDLRTYLRGITPEQRKRFAAAIGATLGHLNNMACGQRPIAPKFAAQIEIHSGGSVTRADCRPDDWRDIWPPQLAHTPPAPEIHQTVMSGIVAHAGSHATPSMGVTG